MKTKHAFFTLLILTAACLQYGMARNNAQYDEEARAEERAEKEARKREKDAAKEAKRHPVREVVSGVKEASFGSASGLVSETVEGSADGPITGTLEGVRQGSGAVLDKTVHGVAKVATLGYGDVKNYEVEEPKANSTDTTKIKIKIPGT
ncbi:MAG: hypothetical protein HYZ84_04810 [Candidatus Omnitrophica bacterium]|nr:hypothetical protein [Candidatus Omnitrophota bacterium]